MTQKKRADQKPTLDDFKSDFQHMTVRHYNDPGVKARVAHRMVDLHYPHIKEACRAWLKEKGM